MRPVDRGPGPLPAVRRVRARGIVSGLLSRVFPALSGMGPSLSPTRGAPHRPAGALCSRASQPLKNGASGSMTSRAKSGAPSCAGLSPGCRPVDHCRPPVDHLSTTCRVDRSKALSTLSTTVDHCLPGTTRAQVSTLSTLSTTVELSSCRAPTLVHRLTHICPPPHNTSTPFDTFDTFDTTLYHVQHTTAAGVSPQLQGPKMSAQSLMCLCTIVCLNYFPWQGSIFV